MSKGRKNGCPVNIRDWQISIRDEDGRWVRVRGLTAMTRSVTGETADGSAGSDLWQEPFVVKRAVAIRLSGKSVGCVASGETDPGQALLNACAASAGCGADAALRFVDPYGQALEADFIVVSAEGKAESDGNAVSWELRQVGEAEALPYLQVRAVALSPASLTLTAGGEPASVRVVFTPENASNRRFRVRLTGSEYAAVSDLSEEGFTVTGLAAGEATVTVISLNGNRTAALNVTVQGG